MSNAFVVSIGALACEIIRRSEFLSEFANDEIAALRSRLGTQTETATAAETILTGMWHQRRKEMGWDDQHLPPWAEKIWDGLVDIEVEQGK